MILADTVQFSLEKTSAPDVLFVGDWARMIRATNAGQDGTQVGPGVSMDGDEAVLAEIETAFETARGVATVPVEFPSV